MKLQHLPLDPHSLTFRITLWLSVSSLMLVILLAFINTRFIQSQYLQAEQEKLSTIISDALKTIGINLSYEFEKAVKETGEDLLANSGIISAIIHSSITGKDYKFSRQDTKHVRNKLSRITPITDPGTGKVIGTLTLIYSRDGYRRVMHRYYINLAITIALYTLLIALLIRFLLKRLVPLRLLAIQMQEFSPGTRDIKLHFDPAGRDEISLIAAAANTMIKNIHDYSQSLETLNRQLKKSHSELEERVRERTRELKEKQMQLAHAGRLAALGELAAGIAHELGQPLQIIKSASIIISDEIREGTFNKEEILPIADKINIQVARAFSIISGMRTFARHDNTNQPMPVDLGIPLTECLLFFRTQFRQHGITLDINIQDGIPRVRTDPQKFQQIVINLLSNARFAVDHKATMIQEPGYSGKIELTLSHDTEHGLIILEVRDNGIGMDSDEKARCLDPFFTTKEPDQGTGLGLSIAYGLIKEFGFQLDILTSPGVGSTFRINMKAEYNNEKT